MPPWITTLLAIAGGIATISGAVVAVRQATPVVRTIIGVFNDFAGEPARPGVEARPGVIESLSIIKTVQAAQGEAQAAQGEELAAIKQTQTEQGEKLAAVQHELHPNSGLSLRDAVDRLEKAAKLKPAEATAVTVNVAAASS